MGDPTPMERHAALGPISWTHGGMWATTSDGFVAEIVQSQIEQPWLVKISEPPDDCGGAEVWGASCSDLRAARVLIAEVIGGFRDAERWRREANIRLVEITYAVMAEVERAKREARP